MLDTVMARLRSLIVWATASLTLTAVVYAPKERMIWSGQSRSWQRSELGPKESPRDFLWLVPVVGTCRDGGYECSQTVIDWSRIAGELLLTLAIGVGLAFVLRPSGNQTPAFVSQPAIKTLTWPQLSPARLWKYLRLKLPWLPPTLFAVSAIGIAAWLAAIAPWSSWPGDAHDVGQESEQAAQPRQLVPAPYSAETPVFTLGSPSKAESAAGGCEAVDGESPHVRNGEEVGVVTSSGHGKLTVINQDSARDAAVLLTDSAGVLDDRLMLVSAGRTATMERIAPGTYSLLFQFGRIWGAGSESFICDQDTKMFDEPTTFEESRDADGINYARFEITLTPVLNGNAKTTSVDATRFHRRRSPPVNPYR